MPDVTRMLAFALTLKARPSSILEITNSTNAGSAIAIPAIRHGVHGRLAACDAKMISPTKMIPSEMTFAFKVIAFPLNWGSFRLAEKL
jgi:hypothetical protein